MTTIQYQKKCSNQLKQRSIDFNIENISLLPIEIIDIIQEYIPVIVKVWLNKTNYLQYHLYVKPYFIKSYESLIRDTIRRDNEFVFEILLKENIKKWFNMKKYIYKNAMHSNYVYFLLDFCVEHESSKCRNNIIEYLEIYGLSKNLHKKNVIRHIR
jgi:hypothetical protein